MNRGVEIHPEDPAAGADAGADARADGAAPSPAAAARHLDAVSVVSLVNDPALHACAVTAARAAARRSGVALQPIAVDCDQRGWNAARGLNAGLDAARHRWVLCIHQDVMLPPTWFDRAERSLATLMRSPGPPAVCGTVGVQVSGRFVGSVRDPNGCSRWGRPPARVIGLDEHLLLVDREAGLRFDPRVPGFHCYGTDLAIRARLAGRDAAVLDAPVVHLSSGRIDPAFAAAAEWMLDRWGGMFDHVIPTPATCLQRVTPGNAVRRRMVATRRRVAFRLRNIARGRTTPVDLRTDLARAVAGLPADLARRLEEPTADALARRAPAA